MSLVSTVVNKDQGDTLTYNLVQKFPLQMWKSKTQITQGLTFSWQTNKQKPVSHFESRLYVLRH